MNLYKIFYRTLTKLIYNQIFFTRFFAIYLSIFLNFNKYMTCRTQRIFFAWFIRYYPQLNWRLVLLGYFHILFMAFYWLFNI